MTSLKIAMLAIATMLAAGCSSAATSSSAPAATSPASPASATSLSPASTPPPTQSAPAQSASPAATAPTPAASATRVPMQTAAGGEFLSPSGNISCEVDYHRAGLTEVYCQTIKPAQSVTMNATGGYKACKGQQCLGNPGENTPTLAYGTATGVGPFMCTSASSGVTCVAGGKGFLISTSGVTSVSA